MSRTSRATVTINGALRQALMSQQVVMGAAETGLSAPGTGLSTGSAVAGGAAMSAATFALVERRAVLAETTRATLAAEGWTVTMVEGDAEHYTGIKATRSDEHLLAAVGADDVITDQAGAHDCAATLQAVLAGLRARGAEPTVTDETEHDGRGGSLYAVRGGPSRAHAIAATLRQAPRGKAASANPASRRRPGPEQLRNTAGGR
jgi:ribosomal protein S5